MATSGRPDSATPGPYFSRVCSGASPLDRSGSRLKPAGFILALAPREVRASSAEFAFISSNKPVGTYRTKSRSTASGGT